jgi:hypothetical protein
MSTGSVAQAHTLVAVMDCGDARPAWRLDRHAVAARLHQLLDDSDQIRQGRLNLCGPAVVFVIWLRRDPVAAATFATRLFEEGSAMLGALPVRPSQHLRGLPYGRTAQGASCPQADWMLMAALRDSANRVLSYRRQGGVLEAAAAITLPGAVGDWLAATGLYRDVRDQTNLVLPKGLLVRRALHHAISLAPAPERDVALLVAQEMFRQPATAAERGRDRVVGLLPNHWVLLRSAVTVDGPRVSFQFWSWGAQHTALLDRVRFARGYHGCVMANGRLAPNSLR